MQPWDALPRLLGGAIFPTPSKSKLSNLPAQHMTTKSEPAVIAGFNACEIHDQESFIGRTAPFSLRRAILPAPSKGKLSNLPAQHMTTNSEPAAIAGFNAFEVRDQESFIGRTAHFSLRRAIFPAPSKTKFHSACRALQIENSTPLKIENSTARVGHFFSSALQRQC